jgi:hypothetical protein
MPPEPDGSMELVPTSNTPHPQAQAAAILGTINAAVKAKNILKLIRSFIHHLHRLKF